MSSWVVAGGSTEIVSRVAGPMLTNANPFRLNSAMPTAAASKSDDADTVTVCVHIRPVCEDTRQVLDTPPG